jgi:signal transduction histidine kinase
MRGRGIATRIFLGSLVAAGVGLAILLAGVLVVGGNSFASLLVEAGDTAVHARQMFDMSVTNVVIVAVALAIVASMVISLVLARRIARSLEHVSMAARRLADGDLSARAPREGPEEIRDLADSFNQMAATLDHQEQIRRDFIANAAHELRTPLTNLQGYLEALRDGVIQADAATYDSLWEEADRLVRLSRDLDALAGDPTDRSSDAQEIDLSAIIHAAVEIIEPQVERAGLTLTVEAPDRLVAHANPDHLRQVLGNLLSNAVRYTPAGGSVTVRAERRPHDLLVSVSNSGAPIPQAELGRVFERFYRVEKSRDRAHGGAGIGLAIVKHLVEASGGRVGADQSDGRTRFWISLSA